MTILVAAEFEADEWQAWWPLLEAALPGERLLRDRRGCDAADIDIALVANPPTGALQGLPALTLIQSLWAGVDKLLIERKSGHHGHVDVGDQAGRFAEMRR